jgi:ribosome-binding ATPase YchF (GTP1/OBG family)
VALEVGIVGLPNSGKTTLFNALTRAGAEITAYATVGEKAHVGMAPIADDRLDQVARVEGSSKVTPAAVRVVDVPGKGAALLGALRQVDALLAVVDGFSAEADPEADLAAVRHELLLADLEHVQRRLERVANEAKSGDPALRAAVTELERVLAHLDAGEPLSTYQRELPAELEPLTSKPLLAIVNGPAGIDAKLEAELAELDLEDAAAFREGEESALAEVVRRLFAALELISFFTASEKEARAWTLRRGQTALDAAGAVHSDLARGFIRCEVIRWSDLVECGSRAEAARRGLARLEGKGYLVEDGDVLNIRFNVR